MGLVDVAGIEKIGMIPNALGMYFEGFDILFGDFLVSGGAKWP